MCDMPMEKRKGCKKRPDPRLMPGPKPELEEFFESVNERMKNLAIARKPYKGRNDKELSIKPGDIFEVLDDVGSWWCLRAPSGRTGHVPKYNLEIIPNPMKESMDRGYEPPADPIVVKVPVIVKTSVQREEVEEKVKPAPRAPSPAPAPKPSPPREPTPPPSQPAPPLSIAPPQSVQRPPPCPPPQSIFPPVGPGSHAMSKMPCHTIVKEIIREVSPSSRYRRHRTKSRHRTRRPPSPPFSEASASSCSSTATSSSSGVASWVSGKSGNYERMLPRNRQGESRSRLQRGKPSRQSKRATQSYRQASPPPQPPAPIQPIHCCHAGSRGLGCRHRSLCCYSGNSRTKSPMSDVSRRYSHRPEPPRDQNNNNNQNQQNQNQQQQPMIILLEAPKQESPQGATGMLDDQSTDDYYDNQPQISIMLPPGAQVGPQLAVGGAYSPQQTQQMQPQVQYATTTQPGYYNWPTSYYQGYA